MRLLIVSERADKLILAFNYTRERALESISAIAKSSRARRKPISSANIAELKLI
jgi:hypothetical protein